MTQPEPVIVWPSWTDTVTFYGGYVLLLVALIAAAIHLVRILRRTSQWKFEVAGIVLSALLFRMVWAVMAGHLELVDGVPITCGPPGDLLGLSLIKNLNPGGISGFWKICQDFARMNLAIAILALAVWIAFQAFQAFNQRNRARGKTNS